MFAPLTIFQSEVKFCGNKDVLYFIISTVIMFKKVSENDQGIPQSPTADQPTASPGRATEHLQPKDIRKTIKLKQPALSSP